jgi:hypothetical protein
LLLGFVRELQLGAPNGLILLKDARHPKNSSLAREFCIVGWRIVD